MSIFTSGRVSLRNAWRTLTLVCEPACSPELTGDLRERSDISCLLALRWHGKYIPDQPLVKPLNSQVQQHANANQAVFQIYRATTYFCSCYGSGNPRAKLGISLRNPSLGLVLSY